RPRCRKGAADEAGSPSTSCARALSASSGSTSASSGLSGSTRGEYLAQSPPECDSDRAFALRGFELCSRASKHRRAAPQGVTPTTLELQRGATPRWDSAARIDRGGVPPLGAGACALELSGIGFADSTIRLARARTQGGSKLTTAEA